MGINSQGSKLKDQDTPRMGWEKALADSTRHCQPKTELGGVVCGGGCCGREHGACMCGTLFFSSCSCSMGGHRAKAHGEEEKEEEEEEEEVVQGISNKDRNWDRGQGVWSLTDHEEQGQGPDADGGNSRWKPPSFNHQNTKVPTYLWMRDGTKSRVSSFSERLLLLLREAA